MDQLQKKNNASKTEANSAFYIIIFLIIISVIFVCIAIFIISQSMDLTNLTLGTYNIPFKNGLYILGGIVALGVLFVLVNSRYEMYFQKRESIGVDRPAQPFGMFWKPGTSADKTTKNALTITSDEFPMTSPATYSVGFELMVADTRANDIQGPFRHIIHRGSNDIRNFTRNSPGSIPKGRGDLNDGLPSEMNPGIFVDQFTNDIIIFVDTDPIKEGNQAFRESIRLTDIPLRKPFSLHVTLHEQILEIYVNCRLAGSKILNGLPRAVSNNWFGLAGFSAAPAIIQNVKLWDIDLYASEIRNMCPKIIISKDVEPNTCSKC
jgi:hypothetical protein